MFHTQSFWVWWLLTLTWANHIDQLISRLNSACFVIRAVNAVLSRKALRILYFSYVHSVISYSIMFWENTLNSTKIFRIQKKVLRIMTKSKKMDSCRELFKTVEILPSYSQFIFSLLLYVVNSKHLFTKNLEVHNHDTRSANNFHLPITDLTRYQKGAHYAGIKIFNHHPTHIKSVGNEIQVFKKALKRFLLDNSFYPIDEYFNSNK